MADTVSTNVIFASKERRVVQILSVSDGTGESAVVKIDKSALTGMNGAEPSKFAVNKIVSNVDGMRVDIFFDRGTDVKIATCGQGWQVRDFSEFKGFVDTGSGGTGDVIVTTTGHTAGDSYDITIDVRLID